MPWLPFQHHILEKAVPVAVDQAAVSLPHIPHDQAAQNEQIERFLKQGYDVVCVNIVDRTAAAVLIDKARASNVPLIFFNREPVEEDRKNRLLPAGPSFSKMNGSLLSPLHGSYRVTGKSSFSWLESLMRWDKVFYVGSDAEQSGLLQGGIVRDVWKADRGLIDRNGDGLLPPIRNIQVELSVRCFPLFRLLFEILNNG